MTEKLPVFATLREGGVVFLRYAPKVGLGLAVVALLGAIGQVLLARESGWSMMAPNLAQQPKPGIVLINSIGSLVYYAALLPFITSYQRLVMQGPLARVEFMYRREEWLVIGAGFRFVLLEFAGILGIFLPLVILAAVMGKPQGGIAAALIGAPLFIAFCVLLLRMTPLFAAAANGQKLSLRHVFNAGKGNTWPILGIMFLPAFPIMILQVILVVFFRDKAPIVAGVMGPIYAVIMLYQSGVWALVAQRLLPRPATPEEPLVAQTSPLE